MARVGADSSESKLIFVLSSVLNVETTLLSRADCSCLPAMIDLISVNNFKLNYSTENNDSSPYRYFFPIIVFDPVFRQTKLFEQVIL